MAIYMKFGSKIKGDVTTGQYKDWIAIQSFSWGVGRHISTSQGSAANREGSHASISEVSVSKNLDPASLDLLTDALIGKMNTEVELHWTLTDKQNAPYLKIKLTNVGLSGYSTSSGGDRPNESLTLNFTKVEVNDTMYAAGADTKQPKGITYDLGEMNLT